jgi:hypothetical protein
VRSGASGASNVDELFLMFGSARAGPTRSIETRYAELVFLHSMRSGNHVPPSGVFGVQNVNALFFNLGWA